MVPRPLNHNFTGRHDTLHSIEQTFRKALSEERQTEQCRIVITGIGGQGKSEICLCIAYKLRHLFWGVFWVDVSTADQAEASFLQIVKTIHRPASTLNEAKQILANIPSPWLLILDNADDSSFDYSRYFPAGQYGYVLLSSRNPECGSLATAGWERLEGLTDEDAELLLLKSVGVSAQGGSADSKDAKTISSLLQSHPLALIQAGSYIAQGHCRMSEYPEIYHRQRKRLLQFSPRQAQSRYNDVYATFEASFEMLSASKDEQARDATELLLVLSALTWTPLPVDVFSFAWKYAHVRYRESNPDSCWDTVTWHVSQLPHMLQVRTEVLDAFRFSSAVQLLTALAIVSCHDVDTTRYISMHPLTHAWAKERQDESMFSRSWVKAGSTIALSMNSEFWLRHQRRLRPHLLAFLNQPTQDLLSHGPRLHIVPILIRCGNHLDEMRLDERLSSLLTDIFHEFQIDTEVPDYFWLDLFDLAARNAINLNRPAQAIKLQKSIIEIRTNTSGEESLKTLVSQYELATAYLKNRQVQEAIQLLEHVLGSTEPTSEEISSYYFSAQHELARAYLRNKEVQKAIHLLESVVKTDEQRLEEDHPDRLWSQHELARAYLKNKQVQKSIPLLEHVVKIRNLRLEEDHPDRLSSQQELATAYYKDRQVQRTIQILEHVVQIREHSPGEIRPQHLTSQHTLGLAYIENKQDEEAIRLLGRVVKIRGQMLEEDSQELLSSQHELARVLWYNRRDREAVGLMTTVVNIRQRVLDPDHRYRVASEDWLKYMREKIAKRGYRSHDQIGAVASQDLTEEDESQDIQTAEEYQSQVAPPNVQNAGDYQAEVPTTQRYYSEEIDVTDAPSMYDSPPIQKSRRHAFRTSLRNLVSRRKE